MTKPSIFTAGLIGLVLILAGCSKADEPAEMMKDTANDSNETIIDDYAKKIEEREIIQIPDEEEDDEWSVPSFLRRKK